MRTAAGFHADDAFGRQAAAAREDQRILARVDVVGYDGEVDPRIERARQPLDEGRLPRADRTADADTNRAHDANNRASSDACRIASISQCSALEARSSNVAAAHALRVKSAIGARSDHKSAPTSRCPSGTARAATAASAAAAELRYAHTASSTGAPIAR